MPHIPLSLEHQNQSLLKPAAAAEGEEKGLRLKAGFPLALPILASLFLSLSLSLSLSLFLLLSLFLSSSSRVWPVSSHSVGRAACEPCKTDVFLEVKAAVLIFCIFWNSSCCKGRQKQRELLGETSETSINVAFKCIPAPFASFLPLSPSAFDGNPSERYLSSTGTSLYTD